MSGTRTLLSALVMSSAVLVASAARTQGQPSESVAPRSLRRPQASGQARFRVGTIPAREVVATLHERTPGQRDGELVSRNSDLRSEQLKQRDADRWEAERLAEEAYSEEALVVARRVVTAQRALVPESEPDIAAALEWYASIAKRFARFDQARAAFQEALQIRTKAQGANDWRTVDARYALERVERLVEVDEQHRQKYRAAQEVLARSSRLMRPQPYDREQILQLEALQLLKEAVGETHPEYAFCLDSFIKNTSFLLRSNSSDARAFREEIKLLRARAQSIRRQTLGERHPDYALSLYNSEGESTPRTADHDREASLRQVLAIQEATLSRSAEII